jgi:hypothetical protein
MYLAMNEITGHEDGGYLNSRDAIESAKLLMERYPNLGAWKIVEAPPGYFRTRRQKEFHANNVEILEEINDLLGKCPRDNLAFEFVSIFS